MSDPGHGPLQVRPSALLVVFVLALAVRAVIGVWASDRGEMECLAACTFLVLLPWGLRNQRPFGDFNVTSHASGMGLYEGLGPCPNPYGVVFDDERLAAEARAAGCEDIDDPAYRGHSFFDHAARGESPLTAVRRHPLDALRADWDRLVFGILGCGLLAANLALLFDRRTWRWGLLLALPYVYVVVSHLPILLGARLPVPAVFGQFIALGIWIERGVFRRPLEGLPR